MTEEQWGEKRKELKLEVKALLDKQDYEAAWKKMQVVINSAGYLEYFYFDDELAALFHMLYSMALQHSKEGTYGEIISYQDGDQLVQKIEEIKYALRRIEWHVTESEEKLKDVPPYIIETIGKFNLINKNEVYKKVADCYAKNGHEEWAAYLNGRYKIENKDVCFILCTNDEFYYEECRKNIEALYVPEGTCIEIIPVRNAASMAAGYNSAMRESKAKYKVYLHQDTFIVNKNFIVDMLRLFDKDDSIGMIGLAGSKKHPKNGVWWDSEEEDCLCEVYQANLINFLKQSYNPVKEYPYEVVESVDGVLLATSVDIPWREDIFDGWHFYDISQSFEMRKRGYKVIIPACDPKWVIHEVGCLLELDKNYEKYRLRFVEEYRIELEGGNIMYADLIKVMQPKPKFNMKWYKGEDLYSEGSIEDLLIKLIAENEPENYTKAIYDNYNWSTYYHLTHLRKNILNWYSFNENARVLEIGCGLGAITDVLCEKCKEVTAVELSQKRATATLLRCRERENLEIIVGNLNDIEFNEKFDYITLIGVLEYQGSYTNTENPYMDFLKKIRKLLKPNGKLLIAIENQYGLKYWCGAREDHTGIPFEGMNQYTISSKKVRTFSKSSLEKLVKDSGFKNTYFYYPMPDYKLPTVVYSQNYLPKNENMQDMNCYYVPDKTTLIAQEENIYKDVIENNVFEFFSNSFLVECTDSDDIGEVTFVSISGERIPEYRIGTRILKNGRVEKFALSKKWGKDHILETKKNEMNLKRRGLEVLESTLEGDRLVTAYTEAELWEERLLNTYAEKQEEKIYQIYDELYEEILKSSEEASWEENCLYAIGLEIEPDREKYGPILKTGYLDMIFRNAFLVDKKIYWFDQEWTLENVPAKYVFFRAVLVLYNSFPDLDKTLSLETIAEHYELVAIWEELKTLEKLFAGAVMDQMHLVESQGMRGSDKANCIANISKIITK